MRTVGTFQAVYDAAKFYETGNGEEIYGGCPMDPVVRREGGQWMLESGMNSAEDADFEVTLEVFDSWFYEGYQDDEYTPSDSDIEDFINTHQPEDEY